LEFLLDLLLLLLCAKVTGELLRHLGFSPLIGEVATGIALGPALLGWVSPNDYIRAVAMLGLVVLMLVTGMNSRFDLFLKARFRALAIAVLGMAASFALGFGAMYAWGYPTITCLFVGAALSNTATEVVARFVGTRPLGQLMLTVAFIDDILAVYVIGILSMAARGGGLDLSLFLRATVGIVAFMLAVAYLSRELIVKRDLMRRLWRFERGGIPITFALSLALALAVVARRVGLHEIIGAYVAGLFISRLRERPDALLLSRIRLNAMLEDLSMSFQTILTPMFFAYVGLSLSPDWGGIKLGVLLTLVAAAFLGKLLGCGGGAAAVGYRGRDRLAIGVAMCARGSLELAVLLLGLEARVVPSEVFAMMTIATLATTVLTPVLFKRVAG
jgi:Kef-type K+ transport system membrane component KefB